VLVDYYKYEQPSNMGRFTITGQGYAVSGIKTTSTEVTTTYAPRANLSDIRIYNCNKGLEIIKLSSSRIENLISRNNQYGVYMEPPAKTLTERTSGWL